MLRLIVWVWTAASGLSLGLTLILFDGLYWRHRDCFNEQGRCLVDGVVFHAQSGVALSLILAALGLAFLAGCAGLWVTRASVR